MGLKKTEYCECGHSRKRHGDSYNSSCWTHWRMKRCECKKFVLNKIDSLKETIKHLIEKYDKLSERLSKTEEQIYKAEDHLFKEQQKKLLKESIVK